MKRRELGRMRGRGREREGQSRVYIGWVFHRQKKRCFQAKEKSVSHKAKNIKGKKKNFNTLSRRGVDREIYFIFFNLNP